MAFVQGSGTVTLSPLNYIFFEKSPRPNHKGWWQSLQRCNCIIVERWLTRCLTTCFNTQFLFHPRHADTDLSSKLSKQDSGESCDYNVLGHCSHLINFISCINHDNLTFIVEVMGWSCGLGDSSCGDKCCYLLWARINRVCVQKDRGRVGKNNKKKSPKEPCAATNVREWINERRTVGDDDNLNVLKCCCTLNLCKFLYFRVYIFCLKLSIERGHLQNSSMDKTQLQLYCSLFSYYSLKDCRQVFVPLFWIY